MKQQWILANFQSGVPTPVVEIRLHTPTMWNISTLPYIPFDINPSSYFGPQQPLIYFFCL